MAAAGKLAMAGAAKLSREWTFDSARLRDFVRAKEIEACQSAERPPKDATGVATRFTRVYVGGVEFRKSLSTDDAETADEARRAFKKRALAIKRGDARLTFQEAYEGWAEWILHQVGVATAKRYAVSLGQLEPFLVDKHLDEIDRKLFAEIEQGRRVKGVTNATIKRDLVALSSVLNFCLDKGWRDDNPVLPRLKRIKERRDPIVLPRPEDVAKVIARAPGLFANLIAAARATGARQEELAGAKHLHLDRKAQRLTVVGKRNKLRVIDLAPFGGTAIFDALPHGIAKAPLFWHGKGERYANVSSRFAGFTTELAANDQDFVRFRFHDLRHLHAVEWLRSGRSIYALQQRLGHDSLKTTEVYLKYLTPEEQQRAKGLAETGTNSGTADAAHRPQNEQAVD
jgi:integrase/recombinase XerD